MTTWKPVVGFTAYEVSDEGDVRRSAPGRRTFVGKVLKPQLAGSGYRFVCLVKGGKSSQRYVHRLVAAAFIGEAPADHEVNHRDGDKSNNHLDNLEYVTRSENCRHAVRLGLTPSGDQHHWWKGGPKPRELKPPHAGERHWTRHKPDRIAKGERSGKNKISAEQVAGIRQCVAAGDVQRDVARRYDLSPAQVCRIIKGTRWA